MLGKLTAFCRSRTGSFLALSALALLVLLWANWSSLAESAQRWATDPSYSHGYLVPGFALVLLWLRRKQLTQSEPEPAVWGAAILAGGIALRLFGAYYHYVYLDAIALLPCVAGVLVMLGGWTALDRKSTRLNSSHLGISYA